MAPLASHLLSLTFIYLFHDRTSSSISSKGISLADPVTTSVANSHEVYSCERVQLSGISRLEISSYSNSVRVTVAPSQRLHANIHVCFHLNASRGMCQCNHDEWKNIHKGIWTSTMSPYEDRFVDVKFIGGISASVTVSMEQDPQHWRLVCLGLGFVMLLLAPIVSSWVPFYYSSSMLIGVLLVVIILIFQVMKVLPTGRKSAFYLTIYGSMVGAGSFILLNFSMMINSILVNFGLDEDMYNPVSVFALVLIVLAGAGLGYWMVRKFIISKDGHVDVGVAQFVKWAMRILGSTFILQSSVDMPLVLGALVSCWIICLAIPSAIPVLQVSGNPCHLKKQKAATQPRRAEFRSRKSALCKNGSLGTPSNRSSPTFNNSPVQGLVSPSYASVIKSDLSDHYSTFHKTPNRKRYSKREWEEFTEDSTRQAMSELASTPEFTEWVIENANRIKLHSDSSSSSESDAASSDETVVISGNKTKQLLRW